MHTSTNTHTILSLYGNNRDSKKSGRELRVHQELEETQPGQVTQWPKGCSTLSDGIQRTIKVGAVFRGLPVLRDWQGICCLVGSNCVGHHALLFLLFLPPFLLNCLDLNPWVLSPSHRGQGDWRALWCWAPRQVKPWHTQIPETIAALDLGGTTGPEGQKNFFRTCLPSLSLHKIQLPKARDYCSCRLQLSTGLQRYTSVVSSKPRISLDCYYKHIFLEVLFLFSCRRIPRAVTPKGLKTTKNKQTNFLLA